jgi:hypothetical protein
VRHELPVEHAEQLRRERPALFVDDDPQFTGGTEAAPLKRASRSETLSFVPSTCIRVKLARGVSPDSNVTICSTIRPVAGVSVRRTSAAAGCAGLAAVPSTHAGPPRVTPQ